MVRHRIIAQPLVGARSVSERRHRRRRTPRRRRGRVDNPWKEPGLLRCHGLRSTTAGGPLLRQRAAGSRADLMAAPQPRGGTPKAVAERGGMVEDRGPGAGAGSAQRALGQRADLTPAPCSRVHKDGRSLAKRGGVVQDRRSLVESQPWCAGAEAAPITDRAELGLDGLLGVNGGRLGRWMVLGLRLGGHGRQSSRPLATCVR